MSVERQPGAPSGPRGGGVANPGLLRWPFPVRFTLFLGIAPLASYLLRATGLGWGQAVLAGFDVAALIYIASLGGLRRERDLALIRAHARDNDTSRLGILLITGLMMVVIITAVTIDLPQARKLSGAAHGWSLALVLCSLVVAWLFANVTMALHYAHMYYSGGLEGGLNFPQRDSEKGDPGDGTGPVQPRFDEFLYFALTIGMAFATSDVELADSDIRWVVTLHSIAAFFYNLIVLAFTVNVTAGG